MFQTMFRMGFAFIVALSLTWGGYAAAQTNEPASDAEETATVKQEAPTLPRAITSFGAARIGTVAYAYGGNIDSPHEYYKGCQSGQLLSWDTADPDGEWKVISEDDELQGVTLNAHGHYLYRVGGFTAMNAKGEPQSLHSLDTFKRFDVNTGEWEILPNLPEGRSSHDAFVIGDQLYVVGGWDMNGDDDTLWHADALVCDLSKEKLEWESLPAPDFERRAIACARHGNILVVAGGMSSDEEIVRAVSFYDPAAKAWKQGPELPGEGMHGFGAAAITLKDQVYVSMMDGKTWCLNAEGTQWNEVADSSARFFQRLLPFDGKLLVIGGTSMKSGKYDTCEWLEVQ